MRRLLGEERIGGRRDRYWKHWGDDGKAKITTESIEDVESVLDRNKRQYADASEKYGKGDLHKVASIPAIVIEEVCRVKGISFADLMNKKSDRAKSIWNELLNSPDFRAFRTRPGRIDTK